MDQLTLTGVATYGSDTLTGNVSIPVNEVTQGVYAANTTYAALWTPGSAPLQFILVTNGGDIDVAVRLTFDTNKYGFFTVPSGCTVALPGLVSVNNANTFEVSAVHVKTASGTADVTYVIAL